MNPRTVSHYEVLGQIGSGGMGVVFKARDQRLDRTVALKLLTPALLQDPDAKARFVREAKAASALDHHNIATIYEIDDSGDGGLFLAMAFYEGRTLADLIHDGPLSLDDAVDFASQAAQGLAEAHLAGIIHCDIKPANLMVTSQRVVKILDFGIARMAHSLATTSPTDVVGTLPYMSPEQLQGRHLDCRTDLWSLGVVLYEMLSGQLPFGGDATSIVAGILGHEPVPLTTHRCRVPRHVDRLLALALTKPVERRVSSAHEFGTALRASSQVNTPHAARPTRVIVLPFHLLRTDPDIDFLSFSLSDAITASLIGLESLQVRSSAAAARFTGSGVDLTAVGRDADVDLVLRGTLVRAGAKVRVQAELIEPATGTALWSQTNDVLMGDLFALQDELTHRIVNGLAAPLSAHDQRRLGRDVPANSLAFEEYLRANELARNVAQWPQARTLYEQCLKRDPRFAPAWARLGRLYWLSGKYVAFESKENFARANAAFDTALALNPDLAMAHHLLTPLQVDLGQAQEAMIRLLKLAANGGSDAEVFAGLVHACRYCGLLNASLRADQRAREIDPRIQTSVMQTRFQLGEYAHVALQDITEFPVIVSTALIAEGRAGEAAERLKAVEDSDHRLREFAIAIRALAGGRTGDSRAAIDRTLSEGFRAPEELYHLSRLLAQLGAEEQSLAVLDRAIAGGFFSVSTLARDPWLDPVRDRTAFERAFQQAETCHAAAVEAYIAAAGPALLGVE